MKFDIHLSDVLAPDTVTTMTATPQTSGTSTTTATPGLSRISTTATATLTATPGPSGISMIPTVTSTTYTTIQALATLAASTAATPGTSTSITTSTTAASQEVIINIPIRGPLRGFPVAMIENLPSTSNILQFSRHIITLLRNFEMTLIGSDNPPYRENRGLHKNEFWQRLFINWHLNMNSRAVETSCFVSYYNTNLVSQFRKF